MKFYSEDTPELIVWDKERKKILCQFAKGEYVTLEKRFIDILAEDYKHEGEILTPKQELQKQADQLLIKYKEKTTTKQLEVLISTRVKRLEEMEKSEEGV